MVVAQRGDDLPTVTGDPSVGAEQASAMHVRSSRLVHSTALGSLRGVADVVGHHIRRGLSRLRERLEVQPDAC